MHRFALLAILLFGALFAIAGGSPRAVAQEGPGGLINPQRDCQTIRTCNYKRGGYYRGCLSTYSCRVCRFERVACRDGGRNCQKMRCTWGGVG